MKFNQDRQPFGKNIQTYIYINNLGRQQFADAINEKMRQYPEPVKIYTSNDIWTYECRGSCPKDKRALMAISEILGKPLPDLFTIVFSREELVKKSEPPCTKVQYKSWNIDLLHELDEEQSEFLLALIHTCERDEDTDKMVVYCDVVLQYDKGKKVYATIRCDDLERTVQWDWKEYGEYIDEFDEASAIAMRLENEIFEPFYAVGLIRDFYCDSYSFDDMPDEYSDIDGYFIGKMFFEIGLQEMVEIYKTKIEEYQKKTASADQ